MCRADSISERQLPWVNGRVILLGPPPLLHSTSVCWRAPIITEDETNGLLCTGHPGSTLRVYFSVLAFIYLRFCIFYLPSGIMRIGLESCLFLSAVSRCLHLYVPPLLISRINHFLRQPSHFPLSTVEHISPPPPHPHPVSQQERTPRIENISSKRRSGGKVRIV